MARPGMMTVLIAALVLAMAAPSGSQNQESLPADIDVFGGFERFSYSLLLQTARHMNQNIVMRPFSVWAMLAALSEGANSFTKAELLNALGYPSTPVQAFSVGAVFSIIAPLMQNPATASSAQLETYNNVFYHSEVVINNSYESTLRQVYRMKMIPIDFAEQDSASKINRAISRATNNKIDAIVSRRDFTDARMVITNGIFFKGLWTQSFDKAETQLAPFYDEQNVQSGHVNMMHRQSIHPYVNMKSLKARVIELSYGQENSLSMVVILPHQKVSLDEVIQKFINVPIAEVFNALEISKYEDNEVDIYLPRFNVTSDFVLNSVLYDMGLRDIFHPEYADFTGISPNKPFCLSRIIHKVQIEVTEEGGAASSVRAADSDDQDAPLKFVANKPFLYLIIEKSADLIVFGGTYVQPSLF